ncbi:MAG: hypothetical protein M1820_009942 [Bogoriella megaspora]|nr:MAG: hypothetical protein M1820_009942 [Bogoriella megaspora]
MAADRKRSRSNAEETTEVHQDVSSSDDDIGPALPTEAPKKKRRKLPHEKLYVAALPASPRYSKSLMHKNQLDFTTFTPNTEFLITSSSDGVIKFWKKTTGDIEFVKEFKAHTGEVKSVNVSADGRSLASAGADNTIKIFDVASFDLLTILKLEFTPKSLCWVHRKSASIPLLAVGSENDSHIRIYDGRGDRADPVHTISALHRRVVSLIAFNNEFDCVLSVDDGGMVEYWRPSGTYEKPDNVFDMKSSTSLFEFKKAKSVPTSITISPEGRQFATFSLPDRKIRIFDFATGKLYRTYDESLPTISTLQQASSAEDKLDDAEFQRRIAVEKELEHPAIRTRINTAFDESGNFLLYGSLFGVKVVNTLTNSVVKLYGRDEAFRPLNISLYQGQPEKKGIVTVEMAASSNPLLQAAESRDAMLVATGPGKVRFYMFTNEEEISKSSRDVQNEKSKTGGRVQQQKEEQKKALQTDAVIHTSKGDIFVQLFPDAAPKAVENFVTHAKNGYYNNTVFHRIIKRFMIQTGDPLGDGTGGESIWGKDFEDEFSSLKHDKPYTVSMANAGPNTNASQFFITTERTPWLDGKHTIFGRATQGTDVIHTIENTKVYKEKPEEDIKIVNISIS